MYIYIEKIFDIFQGSACIQISRVFFGSMSKPWVPTCFSQPLQLQASSERSFKGASYPFPSHCKLYGSLWTHKKIFYGPPEKLYRPPKKLYGPPKKLYGPQRQSQWSHCISSASRLHLFFESFKAQCALKMLWISWICGCSFQGMLGQKSIRIKPFGEGINF
jgi:hypothetical protein